MKTLSERVAHLLSLANGSKKELASIAKVSPPSVSQWINGDTKSIQIEPATRLAKHFGLNHLWISKGIGPMLAQRNESGLYTTGDEKNADQAIPIKPKSRHQERVDEIVELLQQTNMEGLAVILDRAKDAAREYPLAKKTPKLSP